MNMLRSYSIEIRNWGHKEVRLCIKYVGGLINKTFIKYVQNKYPVDQ